MEYIPVRREIKQVSDVDDSDEWQGEIDISGAVGSISLVLTAGEIILDKRQVVKVTTDSSGNVYPTTVHLPLPFPYTMADGTSMLVDRNTGYVGAVSFTIEFLKPVKQ